MGLFNFFKKRQVIHDKVFGELSLEEFKDKSQNFFAGIGYFNEANQKINLIIQVGKSEVNDTHYAFYKRLQNEYSELVDKIIPIITDEFKNWKEEFEILNFDNEFSIDNITIPNTNIQPLNWEISYTTVHDENHWVNISFSDFEPTSIMIDG